MHVANVRIHWKRSTMDADDGRRPRKGVVVSLLDLEDGMSRVIMDDVTSDGVVGDTSWKHAWFSTHKTLSSKDVDNMALSDEDYRRIGISIMARLLALNGRSP